MIDMVKIEKIRQEIERRITDNSFGAKLELIDILAWIDTLSEEPDKSLEEEISRTYHDGSVTDTEDIDHVAYENIAHHFAQWGAEHLRDSTKMIDGSLEEAAREYATTHLRNNEFPAADSAFIAGAEWQAEQLLQGSPMPEDTVLFNKGVAEGRRLEREDMLKDAVEGKVNQDGFLELSNGEVIDICPTLKRCALGLHIGDKVRIVVLKEDEESK